MERLLRSALKPAPGAPDLCPDPGLLAAFVEGSLTANEEAALDGHVAACGRCQEALAVLAHALPMDASENLAEASPSRWFTWAARPRLRWLVPISAAATVAVVFFATRPLIAPEGGVPDSEVVRMAQGPAPSAEAPQAGLDASREQPAAATEKIGLAGVPGSRADVQASAGKPARDKMAAEPATEMMAARAASEEKRAQAVAPAAPAPPAAPAAAMPPPAGQMAAADRAANAAVQEGVVRREAVAEKDRPARPAGAPARLVRALDAVSVTIREPGGAVRWQAGAGGQIARSEDGGATWQPQVSGVAADLLAGSAPSHDVCWIVGSAGTVLITTDGRRWQRRPFPLAVDLTEIAASSPSAAIVTARDGRRFETVDAGLTWTPKQ
jgi:hypothetical protein